MEKEKAEYIKRGEWGRLCRHCLALCMQPGIDPKQTPSVGLWEAFKSRGRLGWGSGRLTPTPGQWAGREAGQAVGLETPPGDLSLSPLPTGGRRR